MSRDQSWSHPWGWDDGEGEGVARAPAVDHWHHCPGCRRRVGCYGPGCGLPRAFRCAHCIAAPLAIPPPSEPDEDGHEE